MHCGEDCGRYPVIWQDKNFCCEGCKTVYQILNENKLGGYYEIYNTPGIKVESKDFGNKYNYLDKEEVIEKLVYFKEGEYSKVKLYIPEIHCSSCIWLLENLYQLDKNITHSSVNFVKKEVDITYKHNNISLKNLVELLSSIHYIPMISLESIDNEKNKSVNKKLIIKLGVAGFAFGNTMLLSMPEYLPGEVEGFLKPLFGYLNLTFALPVLIYSASDYILSAYKNIKHKIVNIDLPISLGILTIFLQSAYEIISGSGTGYMDSLCGLVFFLLIGKWYQNKTYQALTFDRDYKSYFPIAVTSIVDGREDYVLLENIKVGDKLIIHNQELIPADCKLSKGEANINYSFVTGESKPVTKKIGEELYAGGKQVGSTIEVEIVKEVMQSKLTQLWNQDLHSNLKRKDMSARIDLISKYFTAIVLLVATLASIFWWFNDASKIIFVFSSVLIVACPCALALSLPFTYGNSMGIFGNIGFYLRKSSVIEYLSEIDTIIFDKTGTITYADTMSVSYHGNELSSEELMYCKSLSRQSTHPLSQAIYEYLPGDFDNQVENYREITSAGTIGLIAGKTIRMGSKQFTNAGEVEVNEKASRVYVSIGEEYKGVFIIKNKYRDGAAEVIDQLKNNYELHLLSGDNDSEEDRMREIFGQDTKMIFNQSPIDKLEYVKALKLQGKQVLMVGDGLNDAGALSESNVGISIADDVYSFSPACDAILKGSKFKILPTILRKAKSTKYILFASLGISLFYNVIGLYFATTGALSPIVAAILMPVSSVSVVGFVTLATNILNADLRVKGH